MIGALRRWWRHRRQARAAERARRELYAMSESSLRDLGIARGQIELLFR